MKEYLIFYTIYGWKFEYNEPVEFESENEAYEFAKKLAWEEYNKRPYRTIDELMEKYESERAKEIYENDFINNVEYSIKEYDEYEDCDTQGVVRRCPCCNNAIYLDEGFLKLDNEKDGMQFIGELRSKVKAVKCKVCKYIMLFAD
ncbi:hypothetical protein ACU3L3_06985 [Priestia endophytica]